MYPWFDESLQRLLRPYDSDRLAHACLLTGPRGLGKYELARKMALTLLCQQGGQAACGECRSCLLFESGAHPDFRLITFEINTKTDKLRTELIIDQVRNLNASMQLTHSLSPCKVAVIYPAEAMNKSSANALLKTLEEPMGDAVIILVSHQSSRLPATIRSRCQTIAVRLPDEQLALDWLVNSKGADGKDARIALKASAGSPLLAWQMLEEGSVKQFRTVISSLGKVQAGDMAVAEVLDLWSELDQFSLWSWLSLIAAQRLRSCFGLNASTPPPRSESGSGVASPGLARQIARMQTLADRNRNQISTALRKDLLLRDWLIQWSRLTHS